MRSEDVKRLRVNVDGGRERVDMEFHMPPNLSRVVGKKVRSNPTTCLIHTLETTLKANFQIMPVCRKKMSEGKWIIPRD